MSEQGRSDTTHFGFQEVPVREKARRVGAVFSSVASSYDVMNDLMSMGVHRVWKRFTIDLADVRAGETVLDLAGGTGDLARDFARRVGRDRRGEQRGEHVGKGNAADSTPTAGRHANTWRA